MTMQDAAKLLLSHGGIVVGERCRVDRDVVHAIAMMEANVAHKERMLFLFDDINVFGTMRTLETACDEGCKYGVMPMMVHQAIGQPGRQVGLVRVCEFHRLRA
jgi:hypothetical protein